MKTIYFVRHGESEINISDIWLYDNTGLTNKGKKQSKIIASRCGKLKIDIIVSSTLQRSKETAKIIENIIKKPVEYSDLFSERKWPSEQYNLPKDHPTALEIKNKLWGNFSKPRFRYSDEENFNDLKERIKKAFLFLENRDEENILVVTHGFTLRMIVAYAVMGEDITAIECDQFIDKFHTKNTGITIMHYGKKKKRTHWYFSSWNDCSHLTN